MKNKVILFCAIIISAALTFTMVSAQTALGSAFTYQGFLKHSDNPATGSYDFEFQLYDALSDGTQVGSTVVLDDVDVASGLFTVPLDFGQNPFMGDARWLEIHVRPGANVGAYTTLVPRQELTAAPYALTAMKATLQNSLVAADGDPVDAVLVDNEGDVSLVNDITIPGIAYASAVQVGSPSGMACTTSELGRITVEGTSLYVCDGTIWAEISTAPTRTYNSGTGIDGTDSGILASRYLTFTKIAASTAIRVNYTDSFGVSSSNNLAICAWEILVDGSAPTSGALVYNFGHNNSNFFGGYHSNTVVGYVTGLDVGVHTLTIHVSQAIGTPDCVTGLWDSPFVLEVEESHAQYMP